MRAVWAWRLARRRVAGRSAALTGLCVCGRAAVSRPGCRRGLMAACFRAARPCAQGPLSRDCRCCSARLLHLMLAHVRLLEACRAEPLSWSQCTSDGLPQPRKVGLQARRCAAGRIAHRHDPARARLGLHPSCAQPSEQTSYLRYPFCSKSVFARVGLHPSCAIKQICVCVRAPTHTCNTHTPHGLTPLRRAPVCTVHPLSQRMGQTLPLPSLLRCGGVRHVGHTSLGFRGTFRV